MGVYRYIMGMGMGMGMIFPLNPPFGGLRGKFLLRFLLKTLPERPKGSARSPWKLPLTSKT